MEIFECILIWQDFFFPYMQRLDEIRTERWRGDTVEKGQVWMRITEMAAFFFF